MILQFQFLLLHQLLKKSRSLEVEDKLDRFFSEFANLSQRIQNLEQKDSETASSRTSSGRDSVHVARQPVVKTKPQPSSSASSSSSSRLERRSATITRAEAEQQSSSVLASDESGFNLDSKRSFSQSSEDPDPDLEQGEIRSRDEESPAYADTLSTTVEPQLSEPSGRHTIRPDNRGVRIDEGNRNSPSVGYRVGDN